MEDFLESFTRLSMNHSKGNFIKFYLIFKPNYFIIYIPINFLNNYLLTFLITTSIL
jgi:hypothetical protein